MKLTRLPGDKDPSRAADHVRLHDGSAEYGLGGGSSISVRERTFVYEFSMVPLPPGLSRIELRISGASTGAWAVPLDLVDFPSVDEPRYVDVGASHTKHGVTITVRRP